MKRVAGPTEWYVHDGVAHLNVIQPTGKVRILDEKEKQWEEEACGKIFPYTWGNVESPSSSRRFTYCPTCKLAEVAARLGE